MYRWLFHGLTPLVSPNSYAKYAASALIVVCVEPAGTIKFNPCAGPCTVTVSAGMLGSVHVSTWFAIVEKSAVWPASGSHVPCVPLLSQYLSVVMIAFLR